MINWRNPLKERPTEGQHIFYLEFHSKLNEGSFEIKGGQFESYPTGDIVCNNDDFGQGSQTFDWPTDSIHQNAAGANALLADKQITYELLEVPIIDPPSDMVDIFEIWADAKSQLAADKEIRYDLHKPVIIPILTTVNKTRVSTQHNNSSKGFGMGID